jgi:hypothetical protein|tara:strand:- start:404 stop:709 length:306 start_codon:yes stop_codon:yes gene_type:complete
MEEFFKALENFKPKERQKPKVTVDGKEFTVDIETFKEIQMNGEDQYEVKAGKIVRKPLPKSAKKGYEILVKADKGIAFVEGDPYWPAGTKEGGYEWRAQSE